MSSMARSVAHASRLCPIQLASRKLALPSRGSILFHVERLDLLAVALGLAALAGVNLYLTVFATGLAIHFHWITLAPQYQSLGVLGNQWIAAIAGVLYLLEFVAVNV